VGVVTGVVTLGSGIARGCGTVGIALDSDIRVYGDKSIYCYDIPPPRSTCDIPPRSPSVQVPVEK